MSSSPSPIVIGRPLSLLDVRAVAVADGRPTLDDRARAALDSTRAQLLSDVHAGATIYGVNTGFGALSDTRVDTSRLAELQRNLLRSHACGVGTPLREPVVRTLLMLRAHTLAMGASGVSASLVDAILALLDHGVIPCVPSQGSVGASGDLAPLAHLALVLIGEGEAWVGEDRMPGADALAKVGLAAFDIGPKEGLSLINGTQVTTAIGALAAVRAAELVAAADIIGALSVDAGLNTSAAFDPRIHAGKPHPGQVKTASVVRSLLEGSQLNASHSDCGEVQDAYCLRCMPQVHGAVRGAITYATQSLTIEVNSFTDNPLVLARDDGGYDIVSGGNFHAGSIATVLDHLTASLTTLATISERRTDRFMSPTTSRGLPAFLADDPGVESGFMMAQVTAAALASESKAMSFPASVDTIPTSAGKEDHVSMGPIAARKLEAVVDNVASVLAIEAMAAARAMDLRGPKTSGPLEAVRTVIRTHVPPHQGDRVLGKDIQTLAQAITAGEIREATTLPLDC